LFACLISHTFSAKEQCFSLTTNQPTIIVFLAKRTVFSLFIKKGFSSETMHSFLDSHRLSLKIRLTQLICYIYHIVHGQDSTNRCIDLLQVLGALWYLLSIQRQDSCWRQQCRNNSRCDLAYLYCGDHDNEGNAFLSTTCLLSNQSNLPDPYFGIYAPAIKNVSQSKSFFAKFFFCVWWGLQNLRFV